MNLHDFLILLHQFTRKLTKYLEEWIALRVHDELNSFPAFSHKCYTTESHLTSKVHQIDSSTIINSDVC